MQTELHMVGSRLKLNPQFRILPVLSEKQEVLPAEAKCTLCLTNPLMGAFRYEHPVFLLSQKLHSPSCCISFSILLPCDLGTADCL